jgi:XTP/dITP diphosphohydrolase
LSREARSARELTRLPGRLVIATHNAGKLREIEELLGPFGIVPIGAGAVRLEEPEEIGGTFRDNAKLKARAAAHTSGLVALADDSGICVEALDGAPGIYSARWAGPTKDFGAAMARVESELKARAASPPWRAAFVSVLALAWPDGADETFEGRVNGVLVFPPRGTAGFGYDPIFCPDGHDRTFGEMSAEEKHGIPADGSLALSHRARAFQKFARARLRGSQGTANWSI